METITRLFLAFYDALFPRDIHVAIFDTLDVSEIEVLAVRTFIETPRDCIAPFPYKKKLVRYAILATKYHGHTRAVSILGSALAPYLAEELAERRMFGTFLSPLLIPVPLHAKRRKERGYNQAERIATALVRELGDTAIALDTTLLLRHKQTKSQAQRHSKTERLHNLRDAFSVTSPHMVVGKDIILLDDVVTTGATLNSAKRTLQKAGARNILCIAVAH